MEMATTQARITHSGTRFFQFTSLKLQNGTLDTMVTPANTATPQVRYASHGWSRGEMLKKSTSTQMKPAITAALIIRGIDAFRIFALPLTLVGRSTPVLSTYTYFEYVDYQNPYTSAASATILLVMILATTIAYLQIAGTEEVIS